jgi:hypothetical protein
MKTETNAAYPKRKIDPCYLSDLITLFCWLDEEHQSRAVSAVNSILQDQIVENGYNKAL